jgi:hypothetical protein
MTSTRYFKDTQKRTWRHELMTYNVLCSHEPLFWPAIQLEVAEERLRQMETDLKAARRVWVHVR